MAAEDYKRETELVLSPGVHAFVLDQTKGPVSVYCGPYKSSLSNTDKLVKFDPRTKRFVAAVDQADAIQVNVTVPKGSYVVLENPARSGKQPEPGKSETLQVDGLLIGQMQNLAGPWSYPLWPGQVATVIEGHQLRSNQYLLARVVDDEAATANWDKSVVKSAKGGESKGSETEAANGTALGVDKNQLVTGQLIIIKGTEVAFYIPPTGVQVLKDETGNYVRDAVTLERLEYAVLLDEGGNKEYVRGPAVVFPTPTQQFFTKGKDGGAPARKFRAYELQPNNGIHIKVIADYEDGDEKREAGDEMFITGSDTPIYYPREEHAIIKYGEQEKTYAVAIPSGEGRYVMDRRTGVISLVHGPSMFLPNPIHQVIVRRILSDSECDLYYPGNRTIKGLNTSLRAAGNSSIDSTGGGYAGLESAGAVGMAMAASAYEGRSRGITGKAAFADQLERGNTYTPPRTITLDTKYDGAVTIGVWSGYSVQVVNSKGERRTVLGPQTVLLEYDEHLEKLGLSTGNPKTDDNLLRTPYLRHVSNPVSDTLRVKTHDLVTVEVSVKYLVRFDTESQDKWFSVDNYVQYLVDHLRSLIGNEVRNISVQDFYVDAANILRDVVLGKKTDTEARPLKHFVENGMTVYDLEVISVTVADRSVAETLSRARQDSLFDRIQLERAVEQLDTAKGIQDAKRKQDEEVSKTTLAGLALRAREQETKSKVEFGSITAEGKLREQRKLNDKAVAELEAAVDDIMRATEQARIDMMTASSDLDAERQIKLESALAEAHKVRMEAIGPKLVEAMTAMAMTGQIDAIAEHLAPLSIVRGESLAGTFEKLMKGTPLEGMLNNVASMSIPRG